MNYQTIRTAYIHLSGFFSNGIEGIKFGLVTALVVALSGLGISILLQHIAGVTGLFIVGALMLFFFIFLVILIIKKLNKLSRRHVYDERAVQSLAGIYITLKPEIALPYFRGAALSTDSCLEYIHLIKKVRPKLVLELGSGSSTVIAGYQVKRNGFGHVIALDHDEEWGRVTRDLLLEHDLADKAEVRIAPLHPVKLNGRQYHWYDLTKLQDITSIDVLLVDGPPDTGDHGFRYPGLELLWERLSEEAVIIVDDCVMPRWNRSVHTWASEHNFTINSRFLNEKNTLFLVRHHTGIKRTI